MKIYFEEQDFEPMITEDFVLTAKDIVNRTPAYDCVKLVADHYQIPVLYAEPMIRWWMRGRLTAGFRDALVEAGRKAMTQAENSVAFASDYDLDGWE